MGTTNKSATAVLRTAVTTHTSGGGTTPPVAATTGLLTGEEVSKLLKVPRATLTAWRYRKEGPPSFRVGKHVRYTVEGLEKWLNEQASKDGVK